MEGAAGVVGSEREAQGESMAAGSSDHVSSSSRFFELQVKDVVGVPSGG